MCRKILIIASLPFMIFAAQWQSLNAPPAGRADDMSISKQGLQYYIYAADSLHKLYKSTNEGASWDSILDPYVANPICVVTRPNDANYVYIGKNGSTPVWWSTDGGQNWEERSGDSQQHTDITNENPRCFIMDPNNVNIIYVGCRGGGGSVDNIFKTSDKGANWYEKSLPCSPATPNVNDFAITTDPVKGTWIFAGCSGAGDKQGIWLSTDGGANWTQKMNADLIYSIDFAGQEIGYAGAWESVYKTTNSGDDWFELSNSPVCRTNDLQVINSNTVYAATSKGMYKTTDGGDNWSEINEGIYTNGIHSLIDHPGYSQTFFAGGQFCVYKTTDNGSTWIEKNEGYKVLDIYSVSSMHPYLYSIGKPERTDAIVYISSNDGVDWRTSEGIQADRIDIPLYLEIHYNNPQLAYAGYTGSVTAECGLGGRIWRTTDAGKEWENVYAPPTNPQGGPGVPMNCITANPHANYYNYVYAGYDYCLITPDEQFGFIYSANSGANGSWVNEYDQILDHNDIYSIAVNPQVGNMIYAGSSSHGVYKSTDNGNNWTQTTLNNVDVNALAIDFDFPDTLYAGSENPNGIYKTNDGFSTKFQVNNGLDYLYIADLEIDPSEPTIVYTLCRSSEGATQTYVYCTVDRCGKWFNVSSGLPTESVLDIEIDSDEADPVYAATEKGIYTYEPDFNKSLVSSSGYATAYNGGKHLVRVNTTLWTCYESGGVIYVTKSTNLGQTWSKKMELGNGVLPAIDYVEISIPGGPEVGVTWVSRGTSNDTVYFRQYANGSWQNSIVVYTTDGTVGPPSITYTNNQIFVIFNETPAAPNGTYAVCAHFNPGYIPTVDTIDSGAGVGYTSIDYSNYYVHAVWERLGNIYYNYYYNSNWGASPVRVSNNDGGARQPMIEAYLSYIYVSYSDLDASENRNIYWRKKYYTHTSVWSSIDKVTNTANASEYPVLSIGTKCSYSEGGEIWYCYLDALGNWTGHENISNTTAQSAYSHINFYQTLLETRIFFIWTEGNNPPYDVEFQNHTLGSPLPSEFINPGDVEAIPENIHRDGHRKYGNQPHKHHDRGHHHLSYRISNLNPERLYELEFVDYYKEGNAKLRILIDGIFLKEVNVNHGELIREKFEIPEELYSDSTIVVKIKKISGPEASAALFLLYEYEKDSGNGGGPQGNENQIVTPFCFEKMYPNPTKGMLTIKFNSPDERKATVKLYDVTGRLVDEIFSGNAEIGMNEISIRSKKLAAGIYFVRVEAEGYEKTEKVVLLK